MFCIIGEPFLWEGDSSVNNWTNYRGVHWKMDHQLS